MDYEIAATLNAYWANFIKTSNPNTGGSFSGNGSLSYWAAAETGNATTFHLAPARPVNANGLPVGYESVPAAASEHVNLLLEFFESRTDLAI